MIDRGSMNQEFETKHSTIIVGAGSGVGLAVARRFAQTGGAIGLIARNPDHLAALETTLRAEGVNVASAAVDATNPDHLSSAIRGLTRRLGPVGVLCYSPLPDIHLIKPVLQTGAHDFMASLALSVGGAATAVAEVVPAMIDRGYGSLLFTTGSGAVRPTASRAASAIATTAETAYINLLHEELTPAGVRVAQLVVVGRIADGGVHEPVQVADALWAVHDTAGDPVTVLA